MLLRQSLISVLTLAGVAVIAGLFLTLQGRAAAGPSAQDTGLAVGAATNHLVFSSNDVIVQDTGCSPVTGFSGGIVGDGTCRHYVAPVDLPDGAVLTQLDAIYTDNDGAANAVILVARSPLDGSFDGGTGLRIDSVGTPGKTSGTDVAAVALDNTQYDYHLEVVISSANLTFHSAVITYTVPVVVNGDVDCSTNVDAVDALKVLRHVATLSVNQNQPCPPIGG